MCALNGNFGKRREETLKYKPEVIGSRIVYVNGRMHHVEVFAPKQEEIKPEPIASRNDANAPGQKFMREQRTR
jgi:hypothetical protein